MANLWPPEARQARNKPTRAGAQRTDVRNEHEGRLTHSARPPTVAAYMGRHRGFILISILFVIVGVIAWYANQRWEGWEYILQIVGKGDNMPIAGLIPIITFFTYLALDEAFRHDRLIKQGREDEVLDEMYK